MLDNILSALASRISRFISYAAEQRFFGFNAASHAFYRNKSLVSDRVSSTERRINGYQPNVGEYCCARFSEDGRWYRGLVTSSRHTVDEEKGPVSALLDVRVFHVDCRSSEWVSVKDVKPVVTKFLSQPT